MSDTWESTGDLDLNEYAARLEVQIRKTENDRIHAALLRIGQAHVYADPTEGAHRKHVHRPMATGGIIRDDDDA